jgi:KDO2-lipid IV(A) lauroyltransferase
MGTRRRIALENLKLALGSQLGPADRRDVLQEFMINVAVALMELGHHKYLQRDTLRRYISLQGREHLDKALEGGKGVILASAHFGNFPLLLARLSLEDYPVGVVIRDPRHRPMARFLDGWRERVGIRTLRDKPRWASVGSSIGLLKGNGILVLHVDLNVSRGGVFVPFFDLWVPTFRGPAMLAIRSGAPVLPAFIRRVEGLHHQISIHPAAIITPTGDKEEDAWRLLWYLTQVAEAVIREHPEQWLWLHRRFRKARPAAEVGRALPDLVAG